MKILSVNAGSSSLKFTLYEMPEKRVIISGTFEKIGIQNSFYTLKYKEEKIKKEANLYNHKAAILILLDEFIKLNVIDSYEEIEGIGHRVLHGGDKYIESVLIDDSVTSTIEELFPLGPLHNPANLTGIKSFQEVLPDSKQVAVFDTAFHQTMPKESYMYPVPYEWFEKHGVRKYGFHGSSHKFISEFITEKLGYKPKLVNCHIGNGVSVCAIKDGKCIDTSMGLTPLEGVMMGTRSGNIDPGIIPYIMKKYNKTAEEVLNDLNKNSGIFAISQISSDLRDVEEAMLNGDEKATLALNMYVRRIVNYISMYNTLLDGMEILTFTAGVGENSDIVREKIVNELKCLGLELNLEINKGLRGKFQKISTANSKVEIYVVPTDEEVMIAKDTYNLISQE